ncbi:MAG: tRNA 4-thiouridine(8) synthase ThiI [Elusimicrobia bacterium]|jgi:thiamine biosynthesis protein ThiI|nr:tRNA 4-thiouridine(8) synthase ThiI [Elusimicrobiota bacterium]
MKNVVVIHYSELGTKGGNRRVFERKFAEDIRRRLGPNALKVRLESARVIAELPSPCFRENIERALEQVFGVAWYAFGTLFPWSPEDPGYEKIEAAALGEARRDPHLKSFRMNARRSIKTYPFSSQDICVRLGGAVMTGSGLTVDLHQPDLVIQVEVLEREIAVVSGRVNGVRGMPHSSSGRMLCLFSGGIDSPVAAWLMMRRGARVDLLHFHPYRSSEEVLGTKIIGLFEALKIWNPDLRLFLVPHDRYQVSASLSVPTSFETVFFRRFMFRAAEVMGRRLEYQALITGDSLGQVASQTIENLLAVQTDLSLSVFQPVIAYDKNSIIDLARKINVFDLAIQPYKDCCSLMAKKPKTNVAVSIIRRLEMELDMGKMIEESLALASLWDGKTLRAVPGKIRKGMLRSVPSPVLPPPPSPGPSAHPLPPASEGTLP